MNTSKIARVLLLACGLCTSLAQAESFDVMHVPKGTAGPGIKVTFDGVRYATPRTIALTGASTGALVDDAVARVVQAQRQGAPQAYAAVWEQKMRAALIQIYATNMPAWNQLQEEMRAMTAVKLKGVVRYGAITLAWCDLVGPGGAQAKVFPLKSEGGKLVLTNELSDDLVYSQLLILLNSKQN